jgi:hypothetical protein
MHQLIKKILLLGSGARYLAKLVSRLQRHASTKGRWGRGISSVLVIPNIATVQTFRCADIITLNL